MGDVLAENIKARINKLIAGQDFHKAQKLCRKLCEQTPQDAEALFLAGSVYGQLGNYAAAERVLKDALLLAPSHPVLNYNLGIAQFQQARYQQAVESLSRAVQLDPGQFEAWMLLGQACEATGATGHAINSYKQAVALQPVSEKALHALGGVQLKSKMWLDAGNVYASLLELNPGDSVCISNLGIALSHAYQYERLVDLLEPVALNNPEALEPNYYVAFAHTELGEVEDALTFFNRVLDAHPGHAESIVGLAGIYNFKGRYEEALEIIRPLTSSRPDVAGVALVFAAIAPRFKLFREAIALLERHIDNPKLSDHTRANVAVTLGNLYDKQGDFDRAFRYIKRGNELNSPGFDREHHLEGIEVLEALYTEASITTLPVSGSDSNQPIFIIGMPRSGTTLVEQILASHSQVFGAGELKYIQNYCFELHNMQIDGKAFPFCLTDVSPEELLRISKDYQGHLDRLSGGAPRVTDKIPSNHLNLGLIYQLFPRAKVIHTLRDPMDTCVSCYCQFFSGAYQYTYDLDDLGFYYRLYERLMRLWKKVLPLAILDVRYEDLVCDQENMTQKILDFCELPWEQACLEFYKTDRAVATASTDQVRQPMNRDAIGKWRRFEPHVKALAEALAKYS
ncbi:MAG: tetratricopeptide repeat protein [Gammaproteobacteria bacterium]|nr:MAG: tetratricopeptide repeat protein [Gammaproteobacteria bacterium]